MLETSTFYLILIMAGFVMLAMILVHQHNCTDEIRRKTGEVDAYIARLNQKIEVIEQEVVDLQIKIDEVDEEIDTYQQ
ncbi:hypothetical protein [uncultured Pseudodesulfovibrio sp.]|uniref:hypothetical protein n=1 Tax=uncultured Pseudodesulfovibrio sp. TaxID=2035858 RepID=UPI0029C6A7C5|nr:hypothetical protein [uncultured Pseudodesulfovibrio sp.]